MFISLAVPGAVKRYDIAKLPDLLYSGPDLTPIRSFSASFVFGRFAVSADNPLTQKVFKLGRHLFYDVQFSGDDSMSCATCHQQELAFTDGVARPLDIHCDEVATNSMSLSNLLWGPRHFF